MTSECQGGIELQEAKLLIAEGKDEENLFSKLIEQVGLQGIQVLGRGGKTQFRSLLATLKADPAFSRVESLGIVRDANANCDVAFRSVCDALKDAGLPVPTKAWTSTDGASPPRVTVMILPADNQNGVLEDVCLASIEDDPIMTCVNQYFACICEQGSSRPKSLSKAKAHAFMASRTEPCVRVGEGALKGYWNFDHPAFDQIKEFLGRL